MTETIDKPQSRARRGRGGGREGNKRRGGAVITQQPWRIPTNPDRPTEPIDAEGVEKIHDAAMRILEEIGIEFLNHDSLKVLREHGATINGENVRMGRDMVMDKMALVPSSFTLTPRNPITKSPSAAKTSFLAMSQARPTAPTSTTAAALGTVRGLQEFHQPDAIFQLHSFRRWLSGRADGYPPVRAPSRLPLRETDADRQGRPRLFARAERVEDVMEMTRIAGGLTHDEFDATPRMYTNINSTSPLKHDTPMLDGLMRLARRGQPTVVTPSRWPGRWPRSPWSARSRSRSPRPWRIVLLNASSPAAPLRSAPSPPMST